MLNHVFLFGRKGPFFCPGQAWGGASRAAAVKHGPKAHREAARSVLDGREHGATIECARADWRPAVNTASVGTKGLDIEHGRWPAFAGHDGVWLASA
jgi:hypothetical protein